MGPLFKRESLFFCSSLLTACMCYLMLYSNYAVKLCKAFTGTQGPCIIILSM